MQLGSNESLSVMRRTNYFFISHSHFSSHSFHMMAHLFANWFLAKIIFVFPSWQLHAFVEYDTIEDATKAVCIFIWYFNNTFVLYMHHIKLLHAVQIVELNDERNGRSGLRVRLLNTCMVTMRWALSIAHEMVYSCIDV